jgi:membrane-associated protease RseP (regulator of RpoE activity)
MSAVRSLGAALAGRPGSIRRPLAFLIIISAVAELLAPSFLTPNNLQALLTSSSFLIVAAVGEALVILVGMIDLGVESVLAASGMFVAWLTVFHDAPTGLAVALTLAAGVGVGAIAGLLVARGGIPSFIVTLATYWGFRGVALLFNGGNYISPDAVSPSRPFGFSAIAGTIGGVPVLIIVALAAVAGKTMPGTPAASAGLKAGDVITKVNGEEVKDAGDLTRRIGLMKPGDKVELTYLRDGTEKTAAITLASQKTEKTAKLESNRNKPGATLGLELAPASQVDGAGKPGVAVVGVDPNSEGAQKGLASGDVILDVGGKPVSTPQDVKSHIADARHEGRKAVLIRVQTASGDRFVAFAFPNA